MESWTESDGKMVAGFSDVECSRKTESIQDASY